MRYKMILAYASPETSIPINTIGVETATGNKFTGSGSIPTIEFTFAEMDANTTWFTLNDNDYRVMRLGLSKVDGFTNTYCFDMLQTIDPSVYAGLAGAIEIYLNSLP